MIGWLTGASLRFGRLVVAAAVGVLGLGVFSLRSATVDVYPEFTQPSVRVQAEALGLSAQEVEQLITVPLEQDLLNGVPWLEHIRSRSMPGLSAIDLVFEPGTDLYQARQMVQERMTQAKALPNVGTPPIMVPPEASTSRIAMIGMTSTTVSPISMSVLARWEIRPRLLSIPGVANVTIWGQRDRQLQVQVDPRRLVAHKVTLTQLIESTGNALWVSPLSFVEASTPGTGGFVETPNQRLGVQHISPITDSRKLGDVAIEKTEQPLRIGDVADVVEDHQPLIGDAAVAGRPSLMLVVERFPDANTAQVTRDVEDALAAMGPGLSGITLDTQVFRPASFIDAALDNLGITALVALVLLAALLVLVWASLRVAVVALTGVLLSLVTAAYVLVLRGETLTAMTLLGLTVALAMVVHDAVGDAEEIRRRLRERATGSVAAVVAEAVVARRRPLALATVVALIAAAPLLLLPGVGGAFVPSVLASYALALVASLAVACTVTPALAALLLGGGAGAPRQSRVTRFVEHVIDQTVAPLLRRPAYGITTAVVLALAGLLVVPTVAAGPILPVQEDRQLLVRLQSAPGTSLPEMDRVAGAVTAALQKVPGVTSAGYHAGRAVGAQEVLDVDAADVWVSMTPDADYGATVAAMRATLHNFAGVRTQMGTYADDRVAAADRPAADDLVVRVYGPDLDTLRGVAEGVRQVVGTVQGVLAPKVQPQASLPAVEIEVDLAAARRYGLRPGDVRRETSTLISGLTVGSLYEQQKIFDVVVWGGPATRQSVGNLQALLIDAPKGGPVRLGDVARVRIAPNPVAISHDAVSRSLDVTASVHDRSPADVAAEVTSRMRALRMPLEYRAEVLPDAVAGQADVRRLALAGLAAAFLAVLLLQAATSSWRCALVLTVCALLAAAGAVIAAPLVGGTRALVAAGAFAVGALALRQGLLLVRRAQRLVEQLGPTARAESVRQATREEAPSVVVTAVATAAVLLPAAVTGSRAGLELWHPLAVTVLAGLLSALVVVLLVLPTLYLALVDRPGEDPTPTTTPPAAPPWDGTEEVRL